MNDSNYPQAGRLEEAAEPMARRIPWLACWFVGVLILGLAAAAFSRWEWVTPLSPGVIGDQLQSPALDSVTVLRPTIQAAMGWLAWPLCPALLAAGGLVGCLQGRSFWAWANLIAAVVVIPILFVVAFLAFLKNPSPYSVTSELTGLDGRTFAFLDSEFLQGQTLALGVQTRSGILTVSYDEVGSTNGDSPRSWASVIRPDEARDEYGQLYMNKAGLIVGIRYGCHAFFAYDTSSGRFLGHGPIEDVSPFVLIDDGVRMNPRDVEAIAANKGEEGPLSGVPHRKHLLAAADSTRPDIRQAAERIRSRPRLSTTGPSDPSW